MSFTLRAGCEPRCRGCRHKYLSAGESQEQKHLWVQSQLSPYASQLGPLRSVEEDGRWAYRTKTCLHSHWNGSCWEFGLLAKVPAEKHKYEVVDIRNCPVHSEFISRILKELSTVFPAADSFPLVNLAISGSILTLVLKTANAPVLPAYEWGKLGLTGVFLNLSPSAGDRIFANKGWRLVWGDPVAKEAQDDWVYGPESFQQLIAGLHEDTISQTRRFFESQGLTAVMDLYSGSGRTLREWRAMGLPSIGVELNGDSFHCGELNLGAGVTLRGRVSDRRPQLEEWWSSLRGGALGVYLNPPRTGLEDGVAEWIAMKVKPKAIVYLSCSAGTLARDLRILTGTGYSVIKIIPYDFFPQTHHVEVLTLLVRQTA